ncbi:MAG: ECF-type sigma factor [Bryobacteraceae bacterium]
MNTPTFTVLFREGQGGNRAALALAWQIISSDVRRAAGRLLQREFGGRTTQATDLMSELFVRLQGFQCRVLSREHFLNLASRSMRQVLIDKGRKREVRARAEPTVRALYPLVSEPESTMGLAARALWERLHRLDPRAAEAFWGIEVEGWTTNEVAARQKRAAWRVTADCEFAREWMARRLR